MQRSCDFLVGDQVWPFLNSSWDGPSFSMTLQIFPELKGLCTRWVAPFCCSVGSWDLLFPPCSDAACFLLSVYLVFRFQFRPFLLFVFHLIVSKRLPTYCLSAGMLGAVSPSQILSVYLPVSIKAEKHILFFTCSKLFVFLCLLDFFL